MSDLTLALPLLVYAEFLGRADSLLKVGLGELRTQVRAWGWESLPTLGPLSLAAQAGLTIRYHCAIADRERKGT